MIVTRTSVMPVARPPIMGGDMEFWQQVAIGLIGTLLGAAIALTSERLARKADARAREEAALSGLLVDLSLKRAFHIGAPNVADPESVQQDIERCGLSVIESRTLIRDARIQLRPKSSAFEHLAEMAAGLQCVS